MMPTLRSGFHGAAADAGRGVVSVLMPVLNQDRFVTAAIDSVLAQGAIVRELVVVDGGSVDATVAAVREAAARSAGRVRWLSEADSGPAAALNKALALSSAPVVGWLNADDLYEAGAVDRALAQLTRQPQLAMVHGQALHIDADGRPLGPYPSRGAGTPIGAFASGCFICQPTVFMRRTLMERVGAFDESLRAAFDLDYWLRIYERAADQVGFVPALQARSRLHAAAITLRDREAVFEESMRLLGRHLGSAPVEWIRTFAAEAGADAEAGTARRERFERMLSIAGRSLSAADRRMLRLWGLAPLGGANP